MKRQMKRLDELNIVTQNKLIDEAMNYDKDELELYIAEIGWQDWMNKYTEAEEGEPITEAECDVIDGILREAFDIAHDDGNS